MKKIIIAVFALLSVHVAKSQKASDQILGIWKTGTGNAHVEIYKNGNTFQGKIVWMSEPIDPQTKKPKTDTKHPDQNLHSRPLLGLVNLWGFKYDEENDHWQDGHIYDPKNGKEYKCTISLKDKNTINVRGFIGISLIGRTDVWTRVK